MAIWADTVQFLVNTIRATGADSQTILLPGKPLYSSISYCTNSHQGLNYTKAIGFEKYCAPFLAKVRNPDGSTKNLIYEVHQYFATPGQKQFDGQCITDHIEDAFRPLAVYLKANKRAALVAEIGGSPTSASCLKSTSPFHSSALFNTINNINLLDVCAATTFFNQNSDVFIGYLGWAAGAFTTRYEYTLTPNGPIDEPKKGTDQPLLTKCIV